jgi:hypothetical protein
MRCIIWFFLLTHFSLSAQVLDIKMLEKLKIRNVGPANMSGRTTTNSRKEYLISGNFSGSFKNSSNATIAISGSYKKSIEVLQ